MALADTPSRCASCFAARGCARFSSSRTSPRSPLWTLSCGVVPALIRRILRDLLGIVNLMTGTWDEFASRWQLSAFSYRQSLSAEDPSVDVPIPLSNQALVILRRVHVIEHGRVVHRDDGEPVLVRLQDGARSVARGSVAGLELLEQGLVPNHGMPAVSSERGDDGGRPVVAVG